LAQGAAQAEQFPNNAIVFITRGVVHQFNGFIHIDNTSPSVGVFLVSLVSSVTQHDGIMVSAD
jgi:hypothetical protein